MKMKFWKSLTAAALAVVMGVSSVACGVQAGDNKSGNFTVSSDEIAEAMGAGWNLGNSMEASSGGTPSETAWGNPEVTQDLLDAVADAGFSSVRVPVSYLDMIDDENGYTVDTEWLDRVEEVVQYCYNAGLFVIINVHGDGYNTVDGGWFLVNGNDQDYICEKYEALWTQIAERFADYDEHLIFESMNEEFDGEYTDPNTDYYENLNTYNQIFVDTVRSTGSNNTHRWLLVPGWNTNVDYTLGDYGFTFPTDDDCSVDDGRMMLSVHYYDPWDYCGTENMKTYLWGDYGTKVSEANNLTKATETWGGQEYLETQFQRLHDQYVANGIPVVIGEYGCIDKSTANPDLVGDITANRAYFDGYVAGTAASQGIIPVYWDNGYNSVYGFGLFDRTTCEQTQPEIISTIVKAVANKDNQAGASLQISRRIERAAEVHAYIGLQTNVYTFRNSYSDGTYGHDSEYFNTLIKWGEDDEIIDTGATFTDATITGDGTYSVSVSGYDFSQDSEGLNMLFVSTDFAYYPTMRISDVSVQTDDTVIPIDKANVSTDDYGNLYIELVNIYNTELAPLDYTMPTDSFTINFTISGTANVLS